MYFLAFNVKYEVKDSFKQVCKEFKLKSRYDNRMKRWEAYGAKPSKKIITKLKETFDFVWEWQTSNTEHDPYSQNVYGKKK